MEPLSSLSSFLKISEEENETHDSGLNRAGDLWNKTFNNIEK